MKPKPYTIRRSDEECQCQICCWPLDIGDTAYEIQADDGHVIDAGFCSAKCANQEIEYHMYPPGYMQGKGAA